MIQFSCCEEAEFWSFPTSGSPPHDSYHHPFPKLPASPDPSSPCAPQLQFNYTLSGERRQSQGWREGQEFRDETSSDEEDDALRQHDLVVILHLVQCSLDFLCREGLFLALIDGFCEASQTH